MAQNKITPLPIPTVEDSEIVFDDFLKIRRDRLRMPNQFGFNYYTLLTRASSVVVLAFDNEKRLVLNEEYRHPIGMTILGPPGGYLDEGEDILNGGRRELLEETGYDAKTFELLGSAFPYPGISDQKIHYVAAQGAFKSREQHPDPGETIRTVLKDPGVLRNEILNGLPVDGILCTALYFYHAAKSK